MTEPATTALSHRQIQIVFTGLMAGMLLASLDQTIVATALPTIVGDLGGLRELSWVVTAYILMSTISVPLYGKLSDLYGRRRIFQTAIVIFLIGSALSGLAHNMAELIGFRAVQGVGAGGLMATAQAIIGDIVSPRDRGKYQGYLGAVFAFPLQLGAVKVGVLSLYREEAGPLTVDEVAEGLVLSEAVTHLVLAIQAEAPVGSLARPIADLAQYRAVIHQATGMIAAQLDSDMSTALACIRGYAFAYGSTIFDVAADVIARRLRVK